MRKKRKGDKFEVKVQRSVDSGRFPFSPLDLHLKAEFDKYCIEAKETDKKGCRITKALLDKVWNDALDCSKLPAIILRIQDYILTIQISLVKRRIK